MFVVWFTVPSDSSKSYRIATYKSTQDGYTVSRRKGVRENTHYVEFFIKIQSGESRRILGKIPLHMRTPCFWP